MEEEQEEISVNNFWANFVVFGSILIRWLWLLLSVAFAKIVVVIVRTNNNNTMVLGGRSYILHELTKCWLVQDKFFYFCNKNPSLKSNKFGKFSFLQFSLHFSFPKHAIKIWIPSNQ